MKPWMRSTLDFMTTWGGALVLLAVGFWLAYKYVEPAPPGTIRMATGVPGGAYHQFAQRYQAELPDEITLELVPSAGSVANLELLTRSADPVDAAFVQGGVKAEGLAGQLASLGSVLYEPIWVFHRRDLALGMLRELAGQRIGIGPDGSGIQVVARELLAANGVSDANATLVQADTASGAEALIAGDIDALFVIAGPSAGVVERLAVQGDVAIMDFQRADAYVRRYPHTARLALPEGVLDLAANRPERPQALLGVTANLVIRKDLHPALAGQLLQAADRVHSAPGMFQDQGEFPSPRYLVLPLDNDADRFYRYGPPFLQRYLPFWAANLVDRLKIMLLPLIALLLPLLKATPPVYQWRIRSRVYRWYDDLQRLDPRRAAHSNESLEDRFQALERLEQEVSHVQVPLSYADELYHLRTHIDLVRRNLEAESDRTTSSE